MENLRKRCDVRLVADHKKFLKIVSKPTYVGKKEFTGGLVAVCKMKETLVLIRPAYARMCILDLSKTLTYDFHYNYMKKKYGSRAKLGFTDTDSLCCEITAKDVYAASGNSRMRPLAYLSRNSWGAKVRCIVTLNKEAKMKRPAQGLRKMS